MDSKKMSLIYVFVVICVKIMLDENTGNRPASKYSLNMMMMTMSAYNNVYCRWAEA